MPDTTVSLGKGQKRGRYDVTPDQILAAAAQAAMRYGLGEEGARVIQAILKTEGGLSGDVGDVEGGGSYGPTQLYWGGQLGNLARDLGVGLKEAAAWVQQNPIEAVQWSLGGYLGGAIKRGLQAGLSGPALATFAQKVGQVSVSPERAGQMYQALFGQGQGLLGVSTAEAADGEGASVAGRGWGEPPAVRVVRGGTGFADEIDPSTPGLESQQGGTMAQANQTAPAGAQATRGAEVLQRIVQAKGAQPQAPFKLDPTIKNPKYGLKTDNPDYDPDATPTITNPNPTYRFVWDDGTYVDVKAYLKPGSESEAERYEVLPGGTAYAALGKQKTGPDVTTINGKPYVWDEATGAFKPAPGIDATPKPGANKQVVQRNGKAYVWDPETGTFTPATGLPDEAQKPTAVNTNTSEPFIVQQMPDGSITQRPNPNYKKPQPTTSVAGNRIVRVDPETGAITTQVIDQAAQDVATAQAQATLQKTRQELMPGQLLLIQNHAQTVKDLQAQVADPSSQFYGRPDLADQAIQQSKSYLDAALQGTTPFQLQKQREDNERLSRQQGVELVNQRLASSSSLANSLLSAASSLADGALPIPGAGPVHLDPLGYARSFVNDPSIGGGAGVGDLARALLMGGRGNPGMA